MAAVDMAFEIGRHAHLGELHLHLGTVRTRGAGNATVAQRMNLPDRFQRTIDGHQLGTQGGIAALVELGHPGIGQRLAGMGLDHGRLAAHRLADEVARALLLADGPAGFVEHGAQHAIGDGFAVHQHTITVEKAQRQKQSWKHYQRIRM
jgi:hypothetical protein